MYPPTTKENGGAANNNLFAGISLHYFYGIKSILLLSRYIRKYEYVSFYQSCTGLFPCLLFTFPCVYLLNYLFIYHVYWLRFPVFSLLQTWDCPCLSFTIFSFFYSSLSSLILHMSAFTSIMFPSIYLLITGFHLNPFLHSLFLLLLLPFSYSFPSSWILHTPTVISIMFPSISLFH